MSGETLALARQLIGCRSITPDDGGAIELVAARLTRAGFACERIDRGQVRNLWARHGTWAPHVCLAPSEEHTSELQTQATISYAVIGW